MATTPLMSLSLPTPSVTAGPAWASAINAAFTALDGHTHAPGSGAQVPTSGLNINAALGFGGFDATTLRSARLVNQGSPLALGTDIGCIYQSGGNLYYNNASGQQIQITAGAALNAASIGAIGGDYSTSSASEVYVSASQTFQFFQAANKYANLDAGNVILREPGATSPHGVTLKSPTGLAADYVVKFPAALPGAQSFLTLDASGNVGLGVAYSAGLTSAQIAPQGIARSNLPTVGQQVSASCGTFATSSVSAVDVSNLSVAITTTGRPVILALIPDGSASGAQFSTVSGGGSGIVTFVRVGTGNIGSISSPGPNGGPTVAAYPGGMFTIDTPAAGTYTYKVQASSPGGASTSVQFLKLLAFEL